MADVEVRYRDEALVALVVHATRQVDGVARLQRRPVSTVTRRLMAKARRPTRPHLADASAVDLNRGDADTVDVAVRLVSRLDPPPRQVIADVTAAVRAALTAAGQDVATVEVTVTDVRR